mgnify:CR=1 FL=1
MFQINNSRNNIESHIIFFLKITINIGHNFKNLYFPNLMLYPDSKG